MRETHRQHFNGTVGSTRGSFRRSTGIALRDQSGHWRHPERKLREERQIRSGEDQGLKAIKNRTQLNSVHSSLLSLSIEIVFNLFYNFRSYKTLSFFSLYSVLLIFKHFVIVSKIK